MSTKIRWPVQERAEALGWKPKGSTFSEYRWEHPVHGTLRGSGPTHVEAPWIWWAGDDPEREFESMAEALRVRRLR